MWGKHVYVASRRFDESQKDTLVLEFNQGLDSRPLLRPATKLERIRDGGTLIRVWLEKPPLEYGGLLYKRGHAETQALKNLCTSLCPSIDFNLYIASETGKPERVISSRDWIAVDGQTLLERIYANHFPIPPEEGFDDEEDAEESITTDQIEILSRISPNLRLLTNSSGEIVGRACITPAHMNRYYHNIRGTITVGGLNTTHLQGITGILTGSAIKAARDAAIPYVEPPILAKWATEQAELASKLSFDYDIANEMAQFIAICGGDTGSLPIALGKYGGLSFTDIAEWENIPDEILLVHDASVYLIRRVNNDLILEENVLATSFGDLIIAGSMAMDRYTWPNRKISELMKHRVIEAVAKAWKSDPDKIFHSIKKLRRRKIGLTAGKSCFETVYVINNPSKTKH